MFLRVHIKSTVNYMEKCSPAGWVPFFSSFCEVFLRVHVESTVNYKGKRSHPAPPEPATRQGSLQPRKNPYRTSLFGEQVDKSTSKQVASHAFEKHVGAPWKLLGAVLGLAGQHLGTIWEASREHLGAPWRLLEAILGLRGPRGQGNRARSKK